MTAGVIISHSSKLVLWLSDKFTSDPSKFPGLGSRDYVADFLAVDKYLNANVHPNVSVLARIADNEGYLTDHGPGHIKMVTHRASKLICSSDDADPFHTLLTPYEVLLLLMCIHFHDVGNRYGREGHEGQVLELMNRVPQMQTFPITERRTIARIASAHGGRVNGNKDTIQKLLPEEPQTYGDLQYRPQLIAAVLRLADELAEDNSRADNFALLVPEDIPEESKLYHKYAQRLDSVRICCSTKAIDLSFSIYSDDIEEQFGYKRNSDKSVATMYLLDAIFDRTKKTFLEALYCNRFFRNGLNIHFSTVNVVITAFKNPSSLEPFRPPIQYSIKEMGYPFGDQPPPLTQLCPELIGIDGTSLKADLATTNAPT